MNPGNVIPESTWVIALSHCRLAVAVWFTAGLRSGEDTQGHRVGLRLCATNWRSYMRYATNVHWKCASAMG